MAEQTKINPIFKRILLDKTSNNVEKEFIKKRDEVDQQYYLLLEDYKKYYIEYGLDKDSLDLQAAFLREQSMLGDNKKKIFVLNNSIQKAYSKITTEINELETVLKKERSALEKNTIKEKKLRDLDAAALQMLDDSNVEYDKRYITIMNIVIGILTTGFLIYKVPRGEHIL